MIIVDSHANMFSPVKNWVIKVGNCDLEGNPDIVGIRILNSGNLLKSVRITSFF